MTCRALEVKANSVAPCGAGSLWGWDALEDKRMSVGQVSNRNEFPFILRV